MRLIDTVKLINGFCNDLETISKIEISKRIFIKWEGLFYNARIKANGLYCDNRCINGLAEIWN